MSVKTQNSTTMLGEEEHRLPEGWRTTRLEDAGDIVSGITLGRRPTAATRSVPYLRVANVKDGYLELSDIYEFEATEREIQKCKLKRGDLLLTEGGDADKLGRGTFWRNEIPECIHQNHIFRVRFNPREMHPPFISSQIASPYGKRYFGRHAKQTTGIATINKMVLLNFPLLVPPLPEQRRIAKILGEQMAAAEKARAAAEAQPKAIQSPPPYLREVFASREAEEWPKARIATISRQVVDGPHVTPDYLSEGVPFLTVRNIVNRRIDLSDVKFISLDVHRGFCARARAEKGDILYTKDGTLGVPCVVDTDLEFSFFVSVALIKLAREVADPHFVAFALESPSVLEQVDLLGAGAGLKHMVLKSIRALEVPVPSLGTQRGIAAALKKRMAGAEQLARNLQSQLDAITKLPAALLRQAFRGEL